MKESTFFRQLLLAFPKITNVKSRLFRNNVGLGWDYSTKSRLIKYGLAKGSSDGIGWTTIKITEDMVGLSVAVFTAIETKSKTGRLTLEQRNFIDTVNTCGGIALSAKTIDEAKSKIDSYKPT